MLQSIIRDFENGVYDKDKIQDVKVKTFRHFNLHETVNVRPSIMRYSIPIDDKFLCKVSKSIRHSTGAGRRLRETWLPTSKEILDGDPNDHWATKEQLDPLNDVCTKWCTRTYFPDTSSRVNMVANVIRLYDRLRDVSGLDFNIVFKGGVMIRLVLREFIHDIPLNARSELLEYLKEARILGMSDFDFEIVPTNHRLSDVDVNRFTKLTYAVLLWLQRAMQREVSNGKVGGLLSLDWKEADVRNDLKASLQAEVDAIVDTGSPLFGASIDHVFLGATVPSAPRGYKTRNGASGPSRRLNKIVFTSLDKSKRVVGAEDVFSNCDVHGIPTTSHGDTFYATLNTYIGEDDAHQRPEFLKSVFHLARIKHAFVVYYTTRDGRRCCERLSGEMIDLSQSHGIGRDARRRAMYKVVSAPYREYPIIGVDSSNVVLRSYSMHGFLFDHMTMLHHTDVDPWDTKKVEKRIVRYTMFLFAHVFSPDTSGNVASKIKAIRSLVERTNSLEALLSSPPLKTGIHPVNEFARRERTSLMHASSSRARMYLKQMSLILNLLLVCVSEPQQCSAQNLDTTYMSIKHLYRTI